MKQACAYAVVQFRPFVETGEFANVGLVLLGIESGFFDFRLLRKYRRVTQFFHELDHRIYLEAMAGFRAELHRVQSLVRQTALDRQAAGGADMAQTLFVELTRVREGLLRFGETRLVMAEDPAAKLDGLFDHYVDRNFVTAEYQERLLENKVGRLLHAANLPFGPGRIGDEDFRVGFPFVRKEEAATTVIKPLFLGQDDSTGIFNKGDRWISKVKRLRLLRVLPERVLFALDSPPIEAQRRYRAFTDIRDELLNEEISVTEVGNDASILAFASARSA